MFFTEFTNITYTVRLLCGGGAFEIITKSGDLWTERISELKWYLDQLAIGCNDDQRQIMKELQEHGESIFTVRWGPTFM